MFENEQNGIQVTYFTFFMETWEIKAAVFPRENSRGKLVKLYDSSRESAYTTGAGGTREPWGPPGPSPDFGSKGWSPKFATGLNIIVDIGEKV